MADASSNYRSSSSWICDNFSLEVEYFILKIIKAITVSMHPHSIYFPIIFSRSFILFPTLLQDELPLSKNTLLHYKQKPKLNFIHFILLMSKSSQTVLKVIAFSLTFLGYASLHALRQGWSYSKKQIQTQFGISGEFLGIVDAAYLISYSLGMAVLGSLMHRVTLKSYIILGLVLSSASYMLFPIIFGLTSFYSNVLMLILMCFNGFFQATGWPGMMGIFGNWFEKNKKGVLMGIWAMNANVGNIIGSSLCNVLENNGISWIFNFVATGMIAFGVAALIFLFLKEKPDEEEQLAQQAPQANYESVLTSQEITKTQQPPAFIRPTYVQPEMPRLKYGIFSVICLPRVPLYVLGYSCLKGCIYGLLFWLPIFFGNKGGDIESQKGYIASMIDLGSLIGGTAVGFLVDRFDKRALILSPLLLVSAVIMFIVSFALTNAPWQYYIAMFLIGNCIGGPYNIIGTVIAIDIGNNIKEKGSVTKVSSLIEGSAAFFTAISMIFIPRIPFQLIFYLFSAECIIAFFALVPLFLQELKMTLKKRNEELMLKGQQE